MDLLNMLGDKADALRSKAILYIIIGIVVLVIVSLLLDSVRHVIRGLDTAALGALFLWIGTKMDGVAVIKELAPLIYAAGVTLVAVGIIIFIVTRLFGRRRKKKADKDDQ